MSSILVKLPNWLGDILFSIDVLYSLAAQFDRVGLCASVEHAELFEIFPIPRSQLITYHPDEWPRFSSPTRRKLRSFNPDVTLLLTNSIGSALAFRLAGISPLLGFATENRAPLLRRSLPAPKYRMHQTDYYAELLTLLGTPRRTYPVQTQETRGKRVVIHTGASRKERGWHEDRFHAVANDLKMHGYEVVFVSREALKPNGFPAIRTQNLQELAGVLSDSCLLIGNDSGPLHFAQQCGVPVVGVYGPGDPAVTGPRDITLSRVIYHSFPCSPCRQRFFTECAPSIHNKPMCIETIRKEEVIRAVMSLVASSRSGQVPAPDSAD